MVVPVGGDGQFVRFGCHGEVRVVLVSCACVQVLEVLWELAHLPTLPTSLVQQALEEHLGILSDAYAVKETVKRNYIIKCIEDIKKVKQTRRRCSVWMRGLFIILQRFKGHSESESPFYCVIDKAEMLNMLTTCPQ